MSNKRKRGRGVSKCKKAITDFTIKFDENGEAIGKNDKFFMSWVGVEFRKRIPYNKIVQELDNKLYEDVWEYIKESWSILAKSTTLKKGKAIMRNFRHNLAANYVRKDDTPFIDYDYIVWDQNEWDSFVAKVLSEDFEAQSIEARIHALENIEPARVGRCGFSGMRDEWEKRWNQLVSRYACLSRVQDERTKEYTVSRAHYNHDTRLYELGPHLLSESENGVFTGTLQKLFDKEKEMRANGTYYQDGKDVVTEVIGKGRQHGGRTRLVSSVIGSSKTFFAKKKKKTKEVEGLRDKIETVLQDQDWAATTVEASPSRIASSYVSGRSYNDLPEIKSITKCYLISPFNKSFPDTVVARGRVYPTSVRTLHFRPIATGFVKVQVDFVYEDCKKLHVLPQTITDEIEEMGDTQGQLIQWPMNSIKVLDVDSHVSLSPPTSPHYVQSPRQFKQTPDTCQQELGLLQEKGNIYQQPDEHIMNLINESFPQYSTHVHPIPTEPTSNPNVTKHVSDAKERIAYLLKKAKESNKPHNMYKLAQTLVNVSETNHIIEFVSPKGMFTDSFKENVDIESLIQLCVNEWSDVGVLSWFTMYLYIFGGANGKTAYFNPHYTQLSMCKTETQFVKAHIQSVLDLHMNRQYFMAPYIAGSHWVLIMLSRTTKDCKGYIIDSISEGKNASFYVITSLFEEVIGKRITWQMVNCHQQNSTWECGYYVMKAMHDFVITCNEHLAINNPRALHQDEIDTMVEYLLSQFINVCHL